MFMITSGIQEADLITKCNLPFVDKNSLQNGLLYELYNFAKKTSTLPVQEVASYLSAISNIPLDSIPIPALTTKLNGILRDYKSKGGKGRQIYLEKQFYIPTSTTGPILSKVEKSLISELSTGLTEAEKNVSKQQHKLLQLKKDKKALERKLKSSKTKKRLSSKDNFGNIIKKQQERSKSVTYNLIEQKRQLLLRIQDIKSKAKKFENELNKKEQIIRQLQESLKVKDTEIENYNSKLKTFESMLNNLKSSNKDLVEENDYLRNVISDNESIELFDYTSNRYTADTLQCVMNLQNFNVSAANVGPVIQQVCLLCKRQPNKLPSYTTVNRINDMRIAVASKQMKDISQKTNLTLYSDETSKYGKSYEVFAVTDESKNSYLLGLREMHCKSSVMVLDTLKEILHDINDLCSEKEKDDNSVGFKLLTSIKNTMSDRATTEKKFQTLLEEYRREILSQIKEGWNLLSDEEKNICSRMNNFFCSLHLLVNFADVCSETLQKFESSYLKEKPKPVDHEEPDTEWVSSECGTIRLIRTASKAFGRGVDEKSGVYRSFCTYLNSKQDNDVQFVRYKHNRFNIFFLLGQVTYYHRNNIKNFLSDVHGCTNRLLSSVYNDISVQLLLAGCRALGIISKTVTAPLWRDIESKSHISDMNDKLEALSDFLNSAQDDSSEVLQGKFSPFPDVLMNHDDLVMQNLFKPNETDGLTIQILQMLFSSMLTLLKRQAADHLPGGRYSSMSEDIYNESKSAYKHNKLPEFFFGQLDFLLKYRPNATALCNEAYLLYSHNKTADWLDSLEDTVRENLLKESRKEGIMIREKFHERLKEIENRRLETMKRKEKELAEKKKRTLQRKENITNDILYFGLWQSRGDVTLHLDEIRTTTEKKKALKAQLNFRKNVLLQKPSDQKLFLFSSDKKAKTVTELTKQLCQLIDESKSVETVEKTQYSEMPFLVGKYVKHTFTDQVYVGKVVSVVPGFCDWYNIKYENDTAIYVYQLQEDYRNGNIEIVVERYTRVLKVQVFVDFI